MQQLAATMGLSVVATTGDFGRFRLSTEGVPKADRVATWRFALAGNRGIAAVAFESGFGDLSYLIRAFRRSYGATPSGVRKRKVEG